MSEDTTLDKFVGSDESEEGPKPELINGVAWSTIETLPDEWVVNNVESDINILSGNNFSSEYFVEEGGIPLIRIRDLAEDDTTVNFDGDYDSRYLINQQDLLVGMDGEFEPHLWAGPQALLNQRVCKIEPESRYNKIFFRYAIEKPLFYIQKSIAGTTVKHLSQSNINDLNLPTPPRPEQRKIATVLHTVDRAIEKTEAIINQISTVKEGVKDDLLTGGLGDAETTETRLGPVSTEIPTHWDTKRIGDLFTDRQLGTTERGSTEDGGNIDLIKMGNLDFGTWDLSEVEKIEKTPELLKEAGLQRGDLLFNTRNTPELVGKTAVWEFDHEVVYDNNLLRLRFGERISSGHFVNSYLSSNIGRRQLRGRVHGTTSVAAIYWSDLQQVEIPVPPKNEQRKIVDALKELDRTRKHNESYRNRLQRLKSGLMQDLLSGTVRTTDTNIEVPDEIAQHG